jgi:hypothetical protein
MLALAVLAISHLAAAQEPEPSKQLRFDFSPLIGYRTSMTLTSQPDSGASNPRILVNSNPSYGIAFGMRINEEDLVEFHWARQDTDLHLQDTAQRSSNQRLILDQFHADFTHEYILDQWPGWARPFIAGSVGATHLSGGSNSFARFSFGLGTGIKVYANPHFGFRIQAMWLPLLIDPEVKAFVCGGGCVVQVGGKLVSQGEFTMGPVLRF